jgi:hypothetical protein
MPLIGIADAGALTEHIGRVARLTQGIKETLGYHRVVGSISFAEAVH